MIVKMKKLTLLCTPAQQEETLKKLRDLKVVHVEHVKAPEGNELDQARNHLLYVQRAKEVLQARPDADTRSGKNPDELVDTVWKLIHQEKELQETLQALEHEKTRITPFGEFDPREIQKLKQQGLCVKLYELPVKDTPETPEGVAISEISRDKNIIYVLAVGRESFTIPAHEVKLPDRSLSKSITISRRQRRRWRRMKRNSSIMPETSTWLRKSLAMRPTALHFLKCRMAWGLKPPSSTSMVFIPSTGNRT